MQARASGPWAHVCCIRLARGTGPTERSCLQKNVLDCHIQQCHLHTGEAKNPGTAHSARLVLKDRGIPGEKLGSDVSEEWQRKADSQTEAVPLFSWNSILGLLLEGTALGRLLSSVSPRAHPHRPTRRQGPWLLPNRIKMTTEINLTSVTHFVTCPTAGTHIPGCQGENQNSCVKSEGSTQAGSKRPCMCCRVRLIT